MAWLVGTGPGQMGGGAGLGVGEREMVGDHVVQFAGDTHAFLNHPSARLFLPLLGGVLGAGNGVLAAHAHVAAEEGGHQDPGCGIDQAEDPLVRRVSGDEAGEGDPG